MLGDTFDVRSMRDMGIQLEVDETGETFEENALLKAQALMDICHCATLADDSGLCVDALGGRPGVHSARYCGIHGDDEANNQLLLKELDQANGTRSAHYGAGDRALPSGARAVDYLWQMRRRNSARIPRRRRIRVRSAVPFEGFGHYVRRGGRGKQEPRFPPRARNSGADRTPERGK